MGGFVVVEGALHTELRWTCRQTCNAAFGSGCTVRAWPRVAARGTREEERLGTAKYKTRGLRAQTTAYRSCGAFSCCCVDMLTLEWVGWEWTVHSM
jgi:hypothetical protein